MGSGRRRRRSERKMPMTPRLICSAPTGILGAGEKRAGGTIRDRETHRCGGGRPRRDPLKGRVLDLREGKQGRGPPPIAIASALRGTEVTLHRDSGGLSGGGRTRRDPPDSPRGLETEVAAAVNRPPTVVARTTEGDCRTTAESKVHPDDETRRTGRKAGRVHHRRARAGATADLARVRIRHLRCGLGPALWGSTVPRVLLVVLRIPFALHGPLVPHLAALIVGVGRQRRGDGKRHHETAGIGTETEAAAPGDESPALALA